MKIKTEKAWINIKCSECGKVIYPKDVWKLKPEMIINKLIEWKLCEECFNEIFSDDVIKKVK